LLDSLEATGKDRLMDERRASIRREFEGVFGRAPALWSRAPGRVDLMGSHTDYNEGYILTMPIDRDVWIAASPSDKERCWVYSMNLGDGGEFSLENFAVPRSKEWLKYVAGVGKVLTEEGLAVKGFDAVIHSTVPIGGGLSSSAALEAATAMLFQALGGWSIPKGRLARLCQRAENQFVGVNCGILDQYTSILGEAGCAILLDCRKLSHQVVKLPSDLRAVICNTNAPRQLSGSQYGTRRAQCEEGARILAKVLPNVKTLRDVDREQFEAHKKDLPEVVAKRCRFIIEENQRVLDLASALEEDDRETIGNLCKESFAGARDLYEISIPAMEGMIRAMRSAPGAVGARQAGAGFGGCMIAWVVADQVEEFKAHVSKMYEENTGIHPEIYAVEAGSGAGFI